MANPFEDYARLQMVREQIEARGIRNKPLLDVLLKVPRHLSYSGDMHPPKKQICLYFMT